MKKNNITLRAIILALILSVVNDVWIVHLELLRFNFATTAAPFYNCLFTLLVVTVVNMLVRKIRPNLALSRIELLTTYIMTSISSAIISRNMLQILAGVMGHAAFFQTPENGWAQLFLHRLPGWLTVNDPTCLHNFYFGRSTLYTPANYMPWLVPVLAWSGFVAVLLTTLLCINSILRKQWIEAERLTFPIIMLPLEMTEESGSFFKNRLMWLGFGISGGLTLLAGLNYIFPSVPHLQITRHNLAQYITTSPWNAMGNIPMGFYFWAIGISYLMPLDLSFSCWFFFWVVRLERVLGVIVGAEGVQGTGGGFETSFPFLGAQAYGAYLGFCIMSLWHGRRYFAKVYRTAFRGSKEVDESHEALSYRAAMLGAAAGILVLSVFARRLGMSLWVIGIFWLSYLVLSIVANRIRAELGFPSHDMSDIGPHVPILAAVGSGNLRTQDLIGFSMLGWFNRTYASHPSPHQLESFKMAERTQSSARAMFKTVLLAGVIATPLAFWVLLHHYFSLGAGSGHMAGYTVREGNVCYNGLADWMRNPFQRNTLGLGFAGVGLAASLMMGWMRLKYLWFPFHPLAYAIAPSWGVVQLWTPIFLGWLIKSMIIKFGGLPTFRRSLPFFFGLILGEICIGSIWTLVGIFFGIPTYDFWPGAMN